MSPPNLINPYRYATGGAGGAFLSFITQDVETGTVTSQSTGTYDDSVFQLTFVEPVVTGGNDIEQSWNGAGGILFSDKKRCNSASTSQAGEKADFRIGLTGLGSGATGATSQVGYSTGLETTPHVMTGQSAYNAYGASNVPELCQSNGCYFPSSAETLTSTEINAEGVNMYSGSTITILGYGGSASGDIFFEQLADVSITGSPATSLDTGTFAEKRYLYYQIYTASSGSGDSLQFTFNGETSGYAWRTSPNNPASDSTGSSDSAARVGLAPHTSPQYNCGWIFNRNETGFQKNFTGYGADDNDNRANCAGSWSNDTDAITSIQLVREGASIAVGTNLQVYGGSPP